MTETLTAGRKFSGSALRDLRVKAGFSQTLLGNKIGTSYQAVGLWETDRTVPKVRYLPRLADALGCKIDDLFE